MCQFKVIIECEDLTHNITALEALYEPFGHS